MPNRTVGLVSYEWELTDAIKFAVALETGVPTSPGSSNRLVTVYWANLVPAVRRRYENDDWAIHLSMIAHELEAGGGTVPLPAVTGTVATNFGWAGSFGLTIPTKATGENDYISGQVTFARNASGYLGTASDLSTLASVFPFPAQTICWSAIVSYHREWSEQFESNFFASRLALDIELANTQPTIRTQRYAANLKWKPIKKLNLGPEIGYIVFQVNPGGGAVLAPRRGHALAGSIYLNYEF